MRHLIPLLVLLITAPAARAQQHVHGPECGTDLSSDVHRANLEAYTRARDAGLLPVARKSAFDPQVGETHTFNILVGDDINTNTWAPRVFELFDTSADYYLWIDSTRLATMSLADQQKVLDLNQEMSTATPPGSFRTGHGIVENNLYLFGNPPDVDGDGMIDILMYDIEPGRDGSAFTAGFVTSADLIEGLPEGVGNLRDILYLDVVQSLENPQATYVLAGTAAHELTHLIHFAYGGADTFVSEGIAEYAMLANGYFWRGASYLVNPDNLAVPMYTWPANDSPEPRIPHYERASVFFGYVGQRIGPEAMGSVVHDGFGDYFAVQNAVENAGLGLSYRDVLGDFHAANLVNDQALDPVLGHAYAHRSGILAARPPVIDGEMSTSTEASGVFIEGGAVKYLVWKDVRHFGIQVDNPGAGGINRTRIRVRLVLEHVDGTREWHVLAPSDVTTRFDGNYTEVLLSIANVTVSGTSGVEYSVDWLPLSTDAEDPAELPTEVTLEVNYPNPFNPETVVPYRLPEAGPVQVTLFDLLGRHVRTLEDGFQPAGRHEIRLDASSLPAGTYVVVLEAAGTRLSRAITYLP